MDTYRDNEPSPVDDQPDNPQQWHRDPPEPKKPPGWDDNPQRWHRD
jgi:hypothetical protein